MTTHFIYLHLKDPKDFENFWNILKAQVVTRRMPDLLSLHYPPHITISSHFDADIPNDLHEEMIKELSEFKTLPETISLHVDDKILAVEIGWKELSEKIIHLKSRFPKIPWQTYGYHMTLAHGPINGDPEVLKDCVRYLPSFQPSIWKAYRFTVWKRGEIKNKSYSWETKSWTPLFSIDPK